MSIHDVISLISALAPYSWPVAVLILGLLFHRPIARRIEHIKRVKIWDHTIDFVVPSDRIRFEFADETPTVKEATKQLSVGSDVKWENVADVFWLGADLIWTGQIALRGAPKKRILRGLTQSCHHISELGLAERAVGKQLASMKSTTENLPEADLDHEWRTDFSEKIWGVTRMLDSLLRGHQPGYRPDPQS